ncbi:hypothetical protein [Tenacibaculum halocynthiae]|uniref:hypothetical protein n=1 Tax=Tenacibaculum halocynthiae TaxID=1254437 RepID=UPI0038940185
MKIQNKKEAIKKLETLPDKVLIRLAELAQEPKALAYFSCPLKYGAVKGFLK